MHVFNFSPGEARSRQICGFETRLVYKESSRRVKASQRITISKRKTERGEEKEREREKGKKGREEEREIKDKGTKRKFSVHLP